jgi:hypothetical protein
MIPLEPLMVMQTDLRHWDHMPTMISHVKSGGFWRSEYLVEYANLNDLKVSPIIQISRFEDGLIYVHDGHHRCISTWLGGRTYLDSSEYRIRDWKYDQYLEINHANGWYTPFDPRIHLRTADFADFKKKAKEKFLANPAEAEKWIYEHVDYYRRDREIGTVPDLAEATFCRLH